MKRFDMEKIADSLFDGDLPVNLEKIALEKNAKVILEDLENNVSGMLISSKTGKNIIIANSKHHINRQRFTIAHEIAHLILHSGQENVFVDSRGTATIYFRSDKNSPSLKKMESEANTLASCLLMPKKHLENYISNNPLDINDDSAVKLLASRLRVSVQALSIRLAKLDLIH